MSSNFFTNSRLFACKAVGICLLVIFAVCMMPKASAQGPLSSALKKRYRLTEINTQGIIANPGTVLTIEADGINAEPYPTMITFENPVVNGQVKQRSKMSGFLKSSNLQILQPGQKVYITKINEDAGGKEDALKVTILTSDAVLATYTGSYGSHYQTAKRYSTTLAFKMPHGSLAQMSVEDASRMIEAVLSFDRADQVRSRERGTVARTCEPHCAVSTTTGNVIGGAVVQQGPPPPPRAPQGPPPTVSLGQTPDQVTAIMGTPQKVVDLGIKKVFTYPDMKIIFKNNKVVDVQ